MKPNNSFLLTTRQISKYACKSSSDCTKKTFAKKKKYKVLFSSTPKAATVSLNAQTLTVAWFWDFLNVAV